MATKKAARKTATRRGERARRSDSSTPSVTNCRIFPPIGIARVGNSTSAHFIGPEVPGRPATSDDESFKDDQGRIKRQAARFRIYGFDSRGNIVKELTVDDDEIDRIEWSVELANKKAEWYRFDGAQAVANIVSNTGDIPPRRNDDIEGDDRKKLVIGPAKATVSSANQQSTGISGKFLDKPEEVYLGELRTDQAGRLLVLGGRGESGTVHSDNPLRSYANNDRWYDDTSDGPVTARVYLKNGRQLEVRGRSWVIAVPPHFSPHTKNIVTGYDVLVQAALDHKLNWNDKEWGPKPNYDAVSFTDDIYPILERLVMYQWVNQRAQRGHAKGKAGDFVSPATLRVLSDPDVAAMPSSLHKRVFERTRTPLWYPLMPASKKREKILLDPEGQTAINQANLHHMPPISGDEGDATHKETLTWQTLTELQYRRLSKWKDGDFTADWKAQRAESPASLDDIPLSAQPAVLTRASLENCQGGAFFPGIEITSICRIKQFYQEAFRVTDSYESGDITKWMALPWQADFHACSSNWWPAIRPDDVVSVADYERILSDFESEAGEGDIGSLLVDRKRWDRGVGNQFIGQPGLPPFDAGQTAAEYHTRAALRLSRFASSFMRSRPLFERENESVGEYRRRVQAFVNRTILDKPDFPLPSIQSGETIEQYRTRALERLNAFVQEQTTLPDPQTAETVDEYAARIGEFANQNSVCQGFFNLEWRLRHRHAGKNDFVTKWNQMGFVAPKTAHEETVYVETERDKYTLLDFRDYFYILMNEEDYPDFLDKAKKLAEAFLGEGRTLYPFFRSTPAFHHYAPFTYSPTAFRARLEKIYESERRAAAEYNPVTGEGEPLFRTPDDIVQRIRQLAPFNQLDGSWLRNINNAGPINEIGAFMSEIWMDEIGNGDPAQNHANIYTDLLHFAGIYLPPLNSRYYAYNLEIWDGSFSSPVYQHCISTFSEEYFPELLGMTLYLEWEANFLAAMVKLYEYHGYPSLFYRLHVAIDNTVNGHGAKARDAVQLYLDHVRIESGHREMQEHWQRIWNGYISFKWVGGDNWRYRFDNPPSLTLQMINMIEAKKHYGQLNHGTKKLGVNLINDWFDDPVEFLRELSESDYIVKGDAGNTRLFKLMGTTGPMLKVFAPKEIQLWKDWINSLQPDLDGSALDPGQAMVVLINEMRARGVGEAAHETEDLIGPDPTSSDPDDEVEESVKWWFQLNRPELFMKALRNPKNGWIIPNNVGASRFVSELLSDEGAMAKALIRQVPEVGGKTGRQIVIEWIEACCPDPGSMPEIAMAPLSSAALMATDLATEKLSAASEQERREELLAAIFPAAQRSREARAALRQRFYGPGAGAPH